MITFDQIQSVADLAPQTGAKPATSTTGNGDGRSNGRRLDVGRWLVARGVEFRTKPVDRGTAYLVPCAFDPNHGANGESAIVQADSGLLTYECKHNSCQGRRWADYRDAIGKPSDDHYEPPIRRSGKNTSQPSDRETPAAEVSYRSVEPGTVVKATDKGENYGDVVSDNGSSCTLGPAPKRKPVSAEKRGPGGGCRTMWAGNGPTRRGFV